MTATAPSTALDLRCHHCSRWVGEAIRPLRFIGMFKNPADRERLPMPRDSRQCKGCGWVNVFEEAA